MHIKKFIVTSLIIASPVFASTEPLSSNKITEEIQKAMRLRFENETQGKVVEKFQSAALEKQYQEYKNKIKQTKES